MLLQFGTAVLIGILLAKSGLPTGEISVYETLLFIGSLYCFFWIAAGQNSLLQLFPKLDEEMRARALFSIYVFFTLAGIVTAFILYLTRDFVRESLTRIDHLPYLELLVLFLLFNCPGWLIQIFYLLLRRHRAIVVFGLISFSFQLIVVVLPVYMGMTLEVSFMGLIVWAVLKYIWGVVILVKHASWKLDFSFFRLYFPLLLPLLLFAFIGKGTEYISGLVVSKLFDDDQAFAVFRYGAREFPIAVLIVSALATSLIPEVSSDPEKGLQKIRASTRRISHWLFPLSILTMLASPFLFPLVFNPDFKESAYLFNIFTLLLASRILLPQVVAMGYRKNYILTLSALVEMVILATLSWWWGMQFGLQGVAYAAVVAFMSDRMILVYYNWKYLQIKPRQYIDLKVYVSYTLLLVAGFLVSMQL